MALLILCIRAYCQIKQSRQFLSEQQPAKISAKNELDTEAEHSPLLNTHASAAASAADEPPFSSSAVVGRIQ